MVRVWGGHRLSEILGHEAGGEPLGESWEVHGSLTIEEGPHAGQSLDDLCRTHGPELLGAWGDPGTGFPLLTKWLDCQDWLSVQVHPDDALAERLEGPGHRGKTEAWLFWEVQPEARYLHGWKNVGKTGPSLERVQGNTWASEAGTYTPRRGDWAYTPAGTLHALGPGLLVFEVQQSSDLTYRLYDWDRLGLDGRPREMHLEKGRAALTESRPAAPPAAPTGVLGEVKVLSPFFCIEEIRGPRRWSPQGQSVELLTALDAPGRVLCAGQVYDVPSAHSLIVPATSPELEWQSPAESRWIRVRLMPGQESSRAPGSHP